MEVCINPDILHETVLVEELYVCTTNVVLASELPSYVDITLVNFFSLSPAATF